MSKSRKKKKRNYTKNPQRDTNAISKADPLKTSRLLRNYFNDMRPQKVEKKRKAVIDDKRRYRPTSQTHYRHTIEGRPAVIQHKDNRKRYRPDRALDSNRNYGFVEIRKTVVCMRRAARRIALFANGRAGSGVKPNKRRIFNSDSKISCR